MFHHRTNDALSIAEQKRRMKSNQSLLNQKQINHMIHLKNSISAHPRFIKKSIEIPFNILFYGNKIYVLSEIKLGIGGCGTVWAAEEFSLFRKSRWVAIKEGLNKIDYFTMAKILRDHKNKFLNQYDEILSTLYCIQFKKDYHTLSKQQLVEYAKDILQEVSDATFKLAKIHSCALSKIYGISVDIFAVDYFVYSVSPLIHGIDLSKLADPIIFSTIQKNIIESDNTEKSRLQWNYFFLNYIKYLGDTISIIHGLHQKGFLHRDIKPSNIMLNRSGKIELIDFDSCVKMKNGVYKGNNEYSGTLAYLSPKFLDFDEKSYVSKDKKYLFTRAEDIYSLGITLKELQVETVFHCIFILYPYLKNSYLPLFKALMNLSDENVYTRLYAMDYLVAYYPMLIRALTQICEITYQENRSEIKKRPL